jgi:hypothetical protein
MFQDATVEISLWSTVEAGVSVLAANLATLRPLCRILADAARSLSSRVRVPGQSQTKSYNSNYGLGVLNVIQITEIDSKNDANADHRTSRVQEEEVGSTAGLARLPQDAV